MLVVSAMIELELTQEQKNYAQKLCKNIKPIKLLQSASTIWNFGGGDDWKIYLVAASYNCGDLLVDFLDNVYYEVNTVISDDKLGGYDFELIDWDWDFTKGKAI